MIMNQIKY